MTSKTHYLKMNYFIGLYNFLKLIDSHSHTNVLMQFRSIRIIPDVNSFNCNFS